MVKSIYVATPAFGGNVSVNYTQSSLMSLMYFLRNQIPCAWLFRSNESLINRARNKMAHEFLKTECSHLLFIDADIGWTEEDLKNLIESDVALVGGTYPTKIFPINLNFNPVQEQIDSHFSNGRKTIDKFKGWREEKADEKGLIEVMHVPTGFMLISREVFETLAPHVAQYKSLELSNGEASMVKEFFPVRVKDEILESEDWAFCSLAREHGIPVYLQSRVVCEHIGSFTYAVR